MRKVLCALALVALAVAVVSAASVGVAGDGPKSKSVAGTRASAVAKGAVAGGGAKDGAKDGAKAEKAYRRKVRQSPIKGSTPRTMKGKSAAEKGKAKVPAKVSRGNAGMGGAGSAHAPKPVTAKAPANANANANAKGKAPASNGAKGKAKTKTAPAKPAKAARKMKFRALEAADAEAAADAALAASAAADPVAYPVKTADGWQLSARLTITEANVKAVTELFPKLPKSQTFYHWDTFQACTRWTRAGLSAGEMKFFTSNSANMYSGGGLYFAAGFENSAEYGMFPCRVTIKAGTPTYTDAAISSAVSKKLLAVTPDVNEKVALGTVIPFIHQYALAAKDRPPHADWWVTHNAAVFESFGGGNYKLGDGTYLTPHFENNAKGANGNGENAVNIATSLDLYKYWNKLQDVDTLSPPLEPEQAKYDLRDSLKWMKSFTFLFSYIDGASLMRAIGTSPSDPFNVFEKQRFPHYQSVYEKYINARLTKTDASLWGWSAGGKFGNGKDAAAVWAKNALDKLLPGLYAELSNGGVMKFREEEVRAGGDQSGRTFTATSGQVEVMKKNPYLLTVDSPPQADGSILVYYYYPDPLHRNPALKPRVSAALWQAMEDDIAKAVTMGAEAFKKTDEYKRHTSQLMSELILEAFTRVHGQSAAMDQGGLQIMLDLVSIHPCTDFNGRTTRFVGVVSALESSLEPPIAFMSDFDLTTPTDLYGKFLVSGTNAYLKLKKALTAELLTGVCMGQMPDHYHVSYWAKFAGDALAPFMATPKDVAYDDGDWDLIRSRQFVPLMDKKLGTNWKSRAGNPGTPAVQTPGQEPELKVAATATPATPAAPAAPTLAPNDCRNGKGSCSRCTRLNGVDNYGCGYKKDSGDCLTVTQINNRVDGIAMFADDCPRR